MIASAMKTEPTISRIMVVTGGDESGGCSIHRRSSSIVCIMTNLVQRGDSVASAPGASIRGVSSGCRGGIRAWLAV
jgi:hypothetical protein